MKCLSLTQPWASLVMIGAKKYETRSWYTVYRGPLAIHASKGFPGWAKEFAQEPPVSVIFGPDYDFPLGQIIGVVTLVRCERTEDVASSLSRQELQFGDYGEERFAWKLANPQPFAKPIPWRGSLGLWDWPDPATREERR